MSNRMIKDSMLTSDKIAALSDFEFRLWIGLILCVDDLGRGDARAAIIRGRVFPLRDQVSVKDIDNALHGLAAKGCVSLYDVDEKPYFRFPTWGKHQRIRDVKPKYPAPEEENPPCGSLRQSAADCGELRPETKTKPNRNQIESEAEDEDEPRASGGLVGVVVEAVGKLSEKNVAELAGFVRDMGEECVLKALETAQEAGKPTWPYVRGVLRNKRDQGITSAAQWDRSEARFQSAKGRASGPGTSFQPSTERIQKNSDWLEEFLAGQEGRSQCRS